MWLWLVKIPTRYLLIMPIRQCKTFALSALILGGLSITPIKSWHQYKQTITFCCGFDIGAACFSIVKIITITNTPCGFKNSVLVSALQNRAIISWSRPTMPPRRRPTMLLKMMDHKNPMTMQVSLIPHICHFFYTTAIWGLEILHLKVRKFATKVA